MNYKKKISPSPARTNNGPAASAASECGTDIFNIIQIGYGGANVKKKRQNRHTVLPGNDP